MKEITISFTIDELRELAKQLYFGSFITIGFPYDNKKMATEIYTRVCAIGYHEAPESGYFRLGGAFGPLFDISHEIDEECSPVVEQYDESCIEDHLPYRLGDRDFEEKYGKMEPEEILRNPKLLAELEEMQEKYKQEFERYGVLHLRLEEEK